MTWYLAKNVGKWLFPHLALDQRRRQLRVIVLVLTAIAFATGGMLLWMILSRL
jgi:hypothetical protein